MKRITLLLVIFLAISLGFTSCKEDCEPNILACKERPPTDEECLAAFNQWFYNKAKNKCEQIGYSGCSPHGFATKQECEECKCD